MSVNRKDEAIEGTEQCEVRKFVDLIEPEIEALGYHITTQVDLPYTNFCDHLDKNGKGVDYAKGKNSYATDVLIYRDFFENGELAGTVPLVVIEGKIKAHNTHDVITYSEKARTHKAVFPHLQYGFIVLNAISPHFMPLRYYLHSAFDFEEIFPESETPSEHEKRVASFIQTLAEQIQTAEEKYQIFFQKSARKQIKS